MSLFDRKMDRLIEIDIPEQNGIEWWQDFSNRPGDLPRGKWFVDASDYCQSLKFYRSGYGIPGDYGSGAAYVFTSKAPDWLIKRLGIKRDRRIGDRRGGGSSRRRDNGKA